MAHKNLKCFEILEVAYKMNFKDSGFPKFDSNPQNVYMTNNEMRSWKKLSQIIDNNNNF